jgi:predicted CXXCH cytochrome family protein
MRTPSLLWLAPLLCGMAASAAGEGKILRPADQSALPAGDVDIVATAPAGKLLLDGKPVAAEQPFPQVLHAKLKASPGEHKLALVWEGGAQEIRFNSGTQAPAGFAPFHQHPPIGGVDCTHCHELTRRGRFHFKGAESCFTCHRKDAFAKVHTHAPDVLSACGLCHNAHGSTMKAHLLYPKETACKQCHN